MAKKTKRRKLIEKLDKACRDIILIRDKNICQKSGKYVEGCNAHCSHVIPKSQGNALRWDLLNLKLLSYHYHINWWHKSPVDAGEWFKGAFPARWDYLQAQRKKTVRYRDSDLEDLLAERREKLKQLQGE